MKVVIAQIKLKTADFKFNAENVIDKASKCDCDLIVFPQADIEDLGGKDLVLDENCRIKQHEFYQQIADAGLNKNILIGDILIRNGEIEVADDGYFNICGNKVYVSDTYIDDVECDLYVLSKNRYYAMNTYKDFVDSIECHSNLIYVNAILMADESVYAGGSFAKNSDNKLVLQMSMCKEDIETVDFSRTIQFFDESVESQVFDVTTFALKEYCENTGFKKVVLGLSGGLDSTVSAVLMADALGPENVFGVSMPSKITSSESRNDARDLANNLGINFAETSIKNMVVTTNDALNDLFSQVEDKWSCRYKETFTQDNIQARSRAMFLWGVSNEFAKCVPIATSDKSEL